MNLAVISLLALLAAIILSCTSRINVGLLSLVLAWLIGVYIGGMGAGDVFAGFPTQLFLMLVGVTLLFTMAQLNGTLEHLAQQAVRSCRGNTGLIPVMFFFLGLGLASLGPGNIATAAILAPMAMVTARKAQIPAFLMAIMVGNGANSGSLSPFAPTGIIVSGLMAKIGLAGAEWQTYFANVIAHATVAFGGYFVFGGWKLFSRRYEEAPAGSAEPPRLERVHWLTIAAIFLWIIAVLFLRVNAGMAALAAAAVLTLARAADEREALRRIPWSVIVMVCGVTVLIALLEKTGGMALFTALLARISTRETVTGTIAFVTGLISVYSSTSGVVLPAFLPTVPGLVARLGGGDPLAVASSMNVGSHLVDVSPLSTIGALCIASSSAEETPALFNRLLAWGMAMCLIGGVFCFIVFGLLWR